MDFFKEFNKIFSFYNSDVSTNESVELLRNRLYYSLGLIFTPLLTILTYNNQTGYNLFFIALIIGLFLMQFAWSFSKAAFYKNSSGYMLLFTYFVCAFYAILDTYFKEFSAETTFVYLVVLFIITMVINTLKQLTVFYVFNAALFLLTILLVEKTQINKPYLTGFFLIFFVIGYIVAKGRYGTRKKLEERENFLKALFNKAYDAFLLVDFYSGKVVDCNRVALELFELKHKSEIVGYKRDKYKKNKLNDEDVLFIKKTLSEKESWNYHEEYVSKNGKEFWADVIITSLNVDKSIYHVVRIADITEKIINEQKVKESEEKYRNLFERNLAGVYKVRSTDKVLIDCNNAFAKILGYNNKNEITGKICSEIYGSSSDNGIFHDNILKNGQILNYESKIQLKNGKEIWTIENASVISNTGEPEFIEGTIIEITDLINTQQKLNDSKEHYRLMFDKNPLPMWIYERDTLKFIDVNDEAVKHYGYSREEFKNMTLFDVRSAEEAERLKSFLKNMVTNKENIKKVGQWKHQKKNGETIDVEITRSSININGKAFNIALIEDVTHKLSIQNQILQSEKRFKQLSNLAIEGILFTDNARVIDANEQFIKIMGYDSLDEITGKDVNDFVSDEFKDIIKQRFEFEKTDEFLCVGIKKDGSKIYLETRGENIKYDDKIIRASVVNDVTGRINKEKELEESRTWFKNVVEYSPDGIIIILHEKVIYANPSAVKIFGLNSFSEIGNAGYTDFILPEYHEDFKARVEQVKNGQELDFKRKKIRKQNGQIIDVESKPYLMNFGNSDVVLIVLHDITGRILLEKEQVRAEFAEENYEKLRKEIEERKNAELQLNAAQQFTKSIIDSSLDMICATDKKGLITEFNMAAQKTFGYTREEAIGKPVSILYADSKERVKTLNSLMEGSGAFSGEIINKRKNGEKFISFLAASVLKNSDNETIGLMGVSRDITEIEKARKLLEQSEEKYRDLFENATDLIQSVDSTGKILFVNNAWLLALGYKKEEIIGKNIFQFIHPETLEHCKMIFSEVLSGKHKGSIEISFLTKDKNIILAEGNISGKYKDEKLVSTRGIFRDISERRKQEKEIAQTLKEKEVLLKEVHHRVKNNLQVISSILNLQTSYVADDRILQILYESQNRIKSMSYIHDFLYQTKDFNNINFKEYVLNLFTNLVHSYRVYDSVESQNDIDNVILQLDQAIPCGLIINELVSNSLKYAFPENRKGKLKISVKEKKNNKIEMIVQDNGIGLPKNMDYRNTESLGLQLVITLVEQIDGKITCAVKNGTAFKITFKKQIL